MVDILSLKNTPFNKIYKTALRGFDDYEINMEMTSETVQRLLNSCGYDPACSVGAFVKDKLVGIALNGVSKDQKYAYNAGIAVIKGFREMGIGSALIEGASQLLHAKGVKEYILECFEDNIEALGLYSKLNFKLKRMLNCYAAESSILRDLSVPCFKDLKFSIESIKELDQLKACEEILCSWQNRDESILNVPESYSLISVKTSQNNIAGLIVFDKYSGAVVKLVVAKDFRRIGIGTALVKKAAGLVGTDEMTFINIASNAEGINKFLSSLGFQLFAVQKELCKSLYN